MSTNCIFCKIGSGQVPCHKIHEDDLTLAFLDVSPLSAGHALLIPKAHHAMIDELPEELAAACAKVIPRLSRAIRKATGAEGWNVLQNNGQIAGQSVFHVHFHLIPRTPGDALGFRWPAGKLDPAVAAGLVAKIKGNL